MAKKKKLAANSARGYATTSVASRPRPEQKSETAVAPSAKPLDVTKSSKGAVTDETTKQQESANGIPEAPKESQELSPEELEEQLERDELQLLIEKHAQKVRRDASRQVSRAQTECRVIRAQAQSLSVSHWLPSNLVRRILDLAIEDRQHEPQFGSEAHQKASSDEDVATKLWTLQITLLELGIYLDQVEFGLRAVLEKQPDEGDGSYIWGFEEALEFLALQGDQSVLPHFDQRKPLPSSSLLDPEGR